MTSQIARQPAVAPLNEIVRFLLSRLEDDERALKKLRRRPTEQRPQVVSLQRLEIENEVRREIIGVVQRLAVLRDTPAEKVVRDCAMDIMRWLAAAHADHQAFRPDWDPANG